MLGELDSYKQKNEIPSPTYTFQKNKFKMDKILNISHDTMKILEENTGRKMSDIPCNSIFTNMSLGARDIKKRKRQLGPHQIKKLLHG